MRTPAGQECRYFYGNYFRGRSTEECRLMRESGQPWRPALCRTCPVPDLLLANAREFMRLRAEVKRPLSAALQQRVQIRAHCEKTHRDVAEPAIGCGECHPLPPEFIVKE